MSTTRLLALVGQRSARSGWCWRVWLSAAAVSKLHNKGEVCFAKHWSSSFCCSCLIGFGVSGSALADGTPTPDHMMEMGEDSHDHGERIDANGATVKIVDPKDGDVLKQPLVIVRVEPLTGPLGEGKHWHLVVNGKEQGMSQGSSPALQARESNAGENTIEVVCIQ